MSACKLYEFHLHLDWILIIVLLPIDKLIEKIRNTRDDNRSQIFDKLINKIRNICKKSDKGICDYLKNIKILDILEKIINWILRKVLGDPTDAIIYWYIRKPWCEPCKDFLCTTFFELKKSVKEKLERDPEGEKEINEYIDNKLIILMQALRAIGRSLIIAFLFLILFLPLFLKYEYKYFIYLIVKWTLPFIIFSFFNLSNVFFYFNQSSFLSSANNLRLYENKVQHLLNMGIKKSNSEIDLNEFDSFDSTEID